jgi:hypothetical protein
MKYKTIFVDAPTVKSKANWGMSIEVTNGDQLARDVDAAILEKDFEGFELFQVIPVNSSAVFASAYPASLTAGVLLIFKQKSND